MSHMCYPMWLKETRSGWRHHRTATMVLAVQGSIAFKMQNWKPRWLKIGNISSRVRQLCFLQPHSTNLRCTYLLVKVKEVKITIHPTTSQQCLLRSQAWLTTTQLHKNQDPPKPSAKSHLIKVSVSTISSQWWAGRISSPNHSNWILLATTSVFLRTIQ